MFNQGNKKEHSNRMVNTEYRVLLNSPTHYTLQKRVLCDGIQANCEERTFYYEQDKHPLQVCHIDEITFNLHEWMLEDREKDFNPSRYQ